MLPAPPSEGRRVHVWATRHELQSARQRSVKNGLPETSQLDGVRPQVSARLRKTLSGHADNRCRGNRAHLQYSQLEQATGSHVSNSPELKKYDHPSEKYVGGIVTMNKLELMVGIYGYIR
jgi:hypothetical protein